MQLPEPLPGEVGIGQSDAEASTPATDAPPAPKATPKKAGGKQPPQNDGEQPDPSLEQLKNGQLSFRFDDLS